MRILITGSRGLVGTHLLPLLKKEGHEAIPLMRGPVHNHDLSWEPEKGAVAPLEGFGAVIHLAGENISSGRWTQNQKRRIKDSRVRGTALLAETLAKASKRPQVLLAASAIGFYGDRGDEILDESSPAGNLFLSEVCKEWEAAAQPARDAGIRVVHMRFGVILSSKGGALAKMLLPFKMGVGGKIGNGTQYMSWVSIDDVARAILRALAAPSLSGPVNVVSPYPVTNQEFTKTLGKVLSRPTLFPLPAPIARLVFGQMADELLLASQRVKPAKLVSSGFTFSHPVLETVLRALL